MKTEPAPEVVEILDDDVSAFIGANPPPTDIAPTARFSGAGWRWVGSAAAAVLLAIVGFGVFSSAVTSDKSGSPSTPAAAKAQYYVAEPPPGFNMYLAEQRGDGATHAADFAGIGPAELWATVDASATSGAWFVVSQGTQHATGTNSYRTVVDGIDVTIEHDPASGQSRASFSKDGVPLEITARGWFDRQLVRLVRSVGVEASAIHFDDEFFSTDHKRILSSDPFTALFGLPLARVGYATGLPVALAESFTITTGGDDIVDRADVMKFALAETSSFPVGDATAIVGRSATDPSVSIAQWRDGDRLITMRGNVDVGRLETIAATVHKSSDDSVHRQLDTTFATQLPALQSPPATIVSGMLADGWGWTIEVSPRAPDHPAAGYVWWIGQPGDSTTPSETRASLPSGAPTIETVVEHGRTYVLAKVPRSMAGAQLHVNPTGLASKISPLDDVDPQLADLFTADVFLDPVTFTAEIIARDGSTVASWPPL